jgi:hypothetical protein
MKLNELMVLRAGQADTLIRIIREYLDHPGILSAIYNRPYKQKSLSIVIKNIVTVDTDTVSSSKISYALPSLNLFTVSSLQLNLMVSSYFYRLSECWN